MIVVDSSALLAIYFDEPEEELFTETILSVDQPHIGAPNLLEAAMVAEGRHGDRGGGDLDRLVDALGLMAVAFEPAHVEAARDAFRRYGKGRHHAALNFGDCCSYGLAKTLGLPLLFKGSDFALTDVKRAL